MPIAQILREVSHANVKMDLKETEYGLVKNNPFVVRKIAILMQTV
jgi:hypothetical protein